MSSKQIINNFSSLYSSLVSSITLMKTDPFMTNNIKMLDFFTKHKRQALYAYSIFEMLFIPISF